MSASKRRPVARHFLVRVAEVETGMEMKPEPEGENKRDHFNLVEEARAPVKLEKGLLQSQQMQHWKLKLELSLKSGKSNRFHRHTTVKRWWWIDVGWSRAISKLSGRTEINLLEDDKAYPQGNNCNMAGNDPCLSPKDAQNQGNICWTW